MKWYPLAHGQESLWFLWRLAPEGSAYNIVFPAGVHGKLDVAAFRRALQKLSDRHSCLRMEFAEEGGEPRQRALEDHRVHLDEVEAADWTDERLADAVRERARRPFDLLASAAMRVTLFRRGPEHHVLLLVVHHIVSDLWSLIVLMDELRELYPAEKAGTEHRFQPLPLRFEDWVVAQRQTVEGEAGERPWKYWSRELAGELPVLDLPADRSRPPMQSFRGGTVTRRMDAELTQRLKRLAGQERGTLFMALLASYQVLLHRHTGLEDLLVGTPTSGRHRAELTGLVGDFVNMVPLRTDLSGAPTFRQLFRQTRAKVVGAIEFQEYPFSLIVDRLQLARDLSRSPIFQTTFVLQKFQRYEELSRVLLPDEDEPRIPFGDLELEPLPLAQQDGQFDVNLEMKEDEKGRLVGAFKYAADLFEAATIARMAAHFETLLGEIASHPDRPVAELSLLTPEESREVIAGGYGVPVEISSSSICEFFDDQVAKRGVTVAIRYQDEALTYRELGHRVDGLARVLAGLGVGADVLVALLLPRGLDFVALLLAVLKAGGAFLPLDPRHPASRIRRVLEGSGTPLVLTSEAVAERAGEIVASLAGERRPRLVGVESLAGEPAPRSLPTLGGGNLAYVMYTSGSTGQPKGVMVEHRGMVNHMLAKLSDLGMGAEDCLAQNGPQSFDVVVWQCLAPLIVGGSVAVFSDDAAEDPAALIAEVEKQGVSVLQLVPSMLRAVLEELAVRGDAAPALPTLRFMVPTGDALPTELCRRWLELYPDIPVLNTYGSTECSDDQCHYELRHLEPADEAVAVVSIGTPVHNLGAHVLGDNLAPMPVGVVGELYIAGLGVGRGYRNDPVRTALAFMPDPFRGPGTRLYRTHDLARRRADGNLDFLTRIDHMIKLRGFRIEPGEIETALCRHEAISEAAVLALDPPSGERRLVGYAVVSEARPGAAAGDSPDFPDAEELRRFLSASLPQYMVPATFCFLDALPLTANGKLDLRRLPEPAWEASADDEIIAPRTPAEEKIAAVWADVLGLERVGVTADFFAIGGDSIRSIQVVARLRQAGFHFRPSDLFLHQTVAALAAAEDGAVAPADDAELASSLEVPREYLELAFQQVEFEEDPTDPTPTGR